MKNNTPSAIATDCLGYTWLARALGPRDGVLPLSEELWTAVEPLLALHHAAGLLYDRILEGTVETPRLVRYELSARLMRWTEATRDWPELAGQVLDELRRRGIPHLVLKGWALIPLVYEGRRELREVCDLDLLIQRERLADADAVLRAQDYAVPPQAELRAGFAHKFSNEAAYVRNCGFRRPMVVELHWRLLRDPRFCPGWGGDWFDRAQPIQFLGRRLSIPATEDLFIHLCAHAFITHGREPVSPLYRLVDLLRVAGLPGFTWPTVLERTRIASLTASVRSCVEALRALWPEAIPEGVLEDCRQLPFSPSENQMLRQLAACANPWRFDADLRWIPGWGARMEYLRGRLFPSAAFLRSVFHLPPHASYVRGLQLRFIRYGMRLRAWRKV